MTDAGSLKVGNYILLDNVPCVIKSIQVSKTGKHGHAKCRIEAIGIINDDKKIMVMPGHEKVDVPIVEKRSGQILSITGSVVNLMDSESYETLDVPLPEDLKDELKEGDNVMYWVVAGQKVIKQKK